MVRKIVTTLCMAVMLLTAVGGEASAQTYNAYEGSISTTYLTYAKDLLPNLSLNDHYVFIRSDQNVYNLIVGDLIYESGRFANVDPVTVYTWSSTNSYNGYYSYTVSSLDDVIVNPGDKIIYSDLGNYPQLEERGQRYEIINTILFAVFLLCAFIRRIFFAR